MQLLFIKIINFNNFAKKTLFLCKTNYYCLYLGAKVLKDLFQALKTLSTILNFIKVVFNVKLKFK